MAKKRWFYSSWLLKLFVLALPLGFIAVEAGWTVTEVGRQPWIIQGVMRTADAVTPMPGIAWSFYLFTVVYISLSIAVIYLLRRQIKMVPVLYDKVSDPSTLTSLMMEYVVIAFLYLAILLYLLLGGADFGAGIIEMFTSQRNIRRTRKTLYHAIGPIWEANHMWLIIVIVILFVGFPIIYTDLSVYLHIPLLIMLMGIIARGTAFVFRHYDAVQDEMQELYNKVFVWSSFITPFFLGVIAGSTISGHIDKGAQTFLDAYIFSWFNWFSLAVGLFTVVLCGFLASVYLIGEADNENDKQRFIHKAKHTNIIAVVAGSTGICCRTCR